METKKFWCHYTGNDGNTPKRRSIELTRFDKIPALHNEKAKTPLWFTCEEDGHRKDEYNYTIYAQLSDKVAIMTQLYMTSTRLSALSQTDRQIDEEMDYYCNQYLEKYPNLNEEVRKKEMAYYEECKADSKADRDEQLGHISTLLNFDDFLLNCANWVRNCDILAYKEINSPILIALQMKREELMAKRKAEEEERRQKRIAEQKAEEERKRQEAIAEEKRLEGEERKFMDGKHIDGHDLAALCKKHGIKLHLRTIHNLQQAVTIIDKNGSLYYRQEHGKRKPSFDGCYKAADDLFTYLSHDIRFQVKTGGK